MTNNVSTEPYPKIVVITPVKNEAWILDRFLATTSHFADHIIIADQDSTDGSQEICKRYPKVILIRNDSSEFNEAGRQTLLLNAARELVPEHKILLALDADEIISANAVNSLAWQTMLRAKPGTVLCFERLDFYGNTSKCIRSDVQSAYGYIDDGAAHVPKVIHSIRVPEPSYARRLYLNDIKILHYAYTRLNAQATKHRMYSVIEKTLGKSNVCARRLRYISPDQYRQQHHLENSEPSWFQYWEELGIDMHTITAQKYYSYDFEVLRYFKQHGERRFHSENIWDVDWEDCRLFAQSIGLQDISDLPIKSPSKIQMMGIDYLTRLYRFARTLSKGNG